MGAQTERRKQLKRDYLKTPKTMGAYSIRNLDSGRVLVGVSRDVEARLNRHRFALRMGSEDVQALQADWQRLGADAFEFSVLEVLEPPLDKPRYDPTDDLDALQALWCDQLNAYEPVGYNKAPAFTE